MYLHPTNEEEVYNILRNINPNKGPGFDGIRPKDLKYNAHVITPIITTIINLSLINGNIPQQLKTSIVRPIYKQGTKSDYNNYRPISILPAIEKVLEEIVVRRLEDYMDKYKIIDLSQFGFQKGKNINKLLGNFANHINDSISNKMHCLVTFIDFSKAFDTLPHNKLISTLERNGIRGNCIKWFESYLSARTYRVKIDNNMSSETRSDYGVPQGSKLGPILYILYANDMIKTLKNCTTFAYADDTAIVVTHRNLKSSINLMQTQLDTVAKWCHDNGLIINATKTKFMHIKPPHILYTNIKLKFHDTECLHKNNNRLDPNDNCNTYLEMVNTYKYLGVYIDHNFKWKTQVQEVQKKLRKAAFVLHHLSYCTTPAILRQVYYSLVESHIRHGITAWGGTTYSRDLQNSQNRVLKIMMKTQNNIQSNLSPGQIANNNEQRNRYTTRNNAINENLAKCLNILNVASIYQTSLVNEFLDDNRFLNAISHSHNTRLKNAGKFQIELYSNNYGKNTLSVSLPTTMNKLPNHIINMPNTYKRKILVKKHFLKLQ